MNNNLTYPEIQAIMPGAGQGLRLGLGCKTFLRYKGHNILERSVKNFESHCSDIFIAVSDDDWSKTECFQHCPVTFVKGGNSRHQSIANLLQVVTTEWILIHDVTRLFTSGELIQDVIRAALETGAATCGMRSNYPAVLLANDRISSPPKMREMLPVASFYLSQTPQVVRKNILMDCYKLAQKSGTEYSSIPELLHAYGVSMATVECDQSNFKITSRNDWELAKILLDREQE